MTVEITDLVSKDYSVKALLNNWSIVVCNDNLPTDYEKFRKRAMNHKCYAVKESDTDLFYAFFYFDEQIGKDNTTHLFTLSEVVVDKGLSRFSECFFRTIINTIIDDSGHEYRIQVDHHNKKVKSLGAVYNDNIQLLLDWFAKRIKAKFDRTEADLLLGE